MSIRMETEIAEIREHIEALYQALALLEAMISDIRRQCNTSPIKNHGKR